MRKTVVTLLGLMLVSGPWWSAPAFPADDAGIENNHALIAALYQNEAVRFDGLVKLHKVMKQDYQKLLDAGETERAEKLKGMIGHCEMYIKENEEFKNNLFEFAKWHRKLAQEPH